MPAAAWPPAISTATVTSTLVITNVNDRVEVYENLTIDGESSVKRPGERSSLRGRSAGTERSGQESPPRVEALGAAWLQVDLRRASENRYGVGARIEVEAGGRRQIREVRAGSSYMSQSALTAHFGLGSAKHVDRLIIRWPEGEFLTLEKLSVNRWLRVPRP